VYMLRFLVLSIFIVLVTACGGGSGGSPESPLVLEGRFVDSVVDGVEFSSATQKGMTTEGGKYKYVEGEEVTFSIGKVVLGSAIGKGFITPVDLVAGATDESNSSVVNIVRLLLSLDEDRKAENGISISSNITEGAVTEIDFTQSPSEFETNAAVLALLQRQAPDLSLVSEGLARAHLKESLAGISNDLDDDGIVDVIDSDIDGDGVNNDSDAFPNDDSETTDLDGDGTGDNSDPDIDGDGTVNEDDLFPRDSTETSDLDNDGIGNNSDPDRDGDGANNDSDAFPNDDSETADLDGDGTGDNSDPDIDGDGAINEDDVFPRDSTEISDFDGDGVGDNSDPDIDGDGVPNEQDTDNTGPTVSVAISSPQSLVTVGVTPIQVTGTVDQTDAVLTINGQSITHTDGLFSAQVSLDEGHNTIEVRAILGDKIVTDVISVSLDATPPFVTIESHSEGDKVFESEITVTGLINDIVRGTIEEEQSNVTVNGVAATISNRSYSAAINLVEGSNQITVTGSDQVGNTNSETISVDYAEPVGRSLSIVGGKNQSAKIHEVLSEPLQIKVLDQDENPVEGETVVFRVIQGSGAVGVGLDTEGRAVVVETNEEGIAATSFKVGARVGSANHKVRAAVVGYEQQIVINASATGGVGDKISVNSGNNQRGSVGQLLPEAFVVSVTDSGANVVEGARVAFSTIAGDGVFSGGEQIFETQTDSDGRATAEFTLGALTGIDAQRINAKLLDGPKGQAVSAGFTATAFVPKAAGDTRISGVVLDNQDTPIPGVTLRIEGSVREAVTDDQGQFEITEVPVGPVHLIADGSTATIEGEFPSLSYNMVTISGVINPMSAPIYMVKIDTENAVYAGIKDVTLELEDFPGFSLEIAKNSVTFPDGSKEGLISATPVNASKVPMAPPNGMQPQFIVTIQPTGAKFDPPARLTLPNVDAHEIGAQVEMYSFDHDLEEFVSIGLGTVSDDGTTVKSNSGVGVIKAGWHCGSQPNQQGCCNGGGSGSGGCAMCKKSKSDDCGNNDCEPDDSQDPGECQKCSGGSAVNDDSDLPSGDDGKCKSCQAGKAVADADKDATKCSDDPNKACYTCKGGSCKNNCQVIEDSVKNSISASPEWAGLSEYFTKGLNKLPYAKVSIKAIEFSGVNELGTECCSTCTTETAEPQYFNKISGSGKISGLLEIIIPGTGGIGEEKVTLLSVLGVDHVVTLEYKVGVFIDAGINAGASIASHTSACPDQDCFSGSLSAGGTLAGGITGGAGVKYQKVESGVATFTRGLSGKLEGRAVTGYSVVATKGFTDKCPEDKCEIGHDGIKVEAEASATIDVGFFSDSFSIQFGYTFLEPNKGPC